MSKITTSFLVLVSVIFFSSIVYIWQADAEKNNLESQIVAQEEQIANLETQIDSLDSLPNNINVGEVRGVTTSTGKVSGTISLSKDIISAKNMKSKAILVCANETHTQQETCLDFIIKVDTNSYDFEFEIPQGTYEIYAMLPPNKTKMYFSEISNCDNQDCKSDLKKKRLLKVIETETQSDIDIYL